MVETEQEMTRRAAPPTYDDLVALVRDLRERLVVVEAENARLRAAVARLGGRDDPPSTSAPAAATAPGPPPRSKRPLDIKANVVIVRRATRRATRQPVPGRRREIPDRIEVHAPRDCPCCGETLQRGRVVGRRQVIDVPAVRAEVVEHQVRERRCRRCGWTGREAMPDLRAQVGPHRRLSWGVAALVATVRTKLRLPLAQVQWLLAQTWGLRLSVGAISGLLRDVAQAGKPAYDALLAEARASPVVHLDETGWRENGRNGYIWTVNTPIVRLFQYVQSRAGAVAERLVGEGGTGTVVSDFYAAYDRLDRPRQRCWAHLLRDVRAVCADHPTDHRLGRWAAAVGKRYARAMHWAERATTEDVRPICRERVADRFARALVAICRSQSATSPQAVLCQRIERYQTELFLFVADSQVPSTNNAAERSLRPLVIARKISGGSRSKHGSQTRMILQSLVATWEVRDLDPVAEFLSLLRDRALTARELAPV
jgi:hypothetical protein